VLFKQFTNQLPGSRSDSDYFLRSGRRAGWRIARLGSRTESVGRQGGEQDCRRTWILLAAVASPDSLPRDTAKLLVVHQTKSIVPVRSWKALRFWWMAYMIEQQPFALGIVAIAVLSMVLTFHPWPRAAVARIATRPHRRTATVWRFLCSRTMRIAGPLY